VTELVGQGDPSILLAQRTYAQAELHAMTDDLWGVVGYDQDPIEAALGVFPAPERRRSDTEFECPPEVEPELRRRAEKLGPGRPHAETLKHLNVEQVDAEVVEPGQLHKTATEFWEALGSDQQGPIMVFGSDREVQLWKVVKKQVQEGQIDPERLSTARLLAIGGRGLGNMGGAQFFRRAGQFDERVHSGTVDLEALARDLPEELTEFQVTEQFLRTAVDEGTETDEVLPIGYDTETGAIIHSPTGQVRKLGSVNGRDVILVHKLLAKTGPTPKDTTTPTMLLMSDIAADVVGKPNVTISFYSSATYKPSRLAAGIKAGLIAAKDAVNSRFRRVVVPTYGYEELSMVQGKDNPQPPSIQNIAGEMGKAAQQAHDLREFLAAA
jgi:hypothetical protein